MNTKRLLAVLATFGLLSLVACTADAGESPEAAQPVAVAATDCGSPTPSESPTPTLTESPSPTPTETTPPTAPLKVIGMSSPANLWPQRLAEVGPCGIEARRIYADLTSSGITQRPLIESAIAAGMTPVVSVKVPSFTTAGSGGYNAWADRAADQLDAYGVRILIAVWHEPSDDMTGPQFLAMEHQLIPRFDRPNLRTYAINHGFLLDGQVAKFSSYADDELLNELSYYGIDTYQSGTLSNPGPKEPSHRIAALVQWLDDHGHPDMPVVIGEFSAYTAAAMTRAGEAILSTPNVAYALEFNSQTGGKGVPLTGSRLAAFQQTKLDPRALHDPAC